MLPHCGPGWGASRITVWSRLIGELFEPVALSICRWLRCVQHSPRRGKVQFTICTTFSSTRESTIWATLSPTRERSSPRPLQKRWLTHCSFYTINIPGNSIFSINTKITEFGIKKKKIPTWKSLSMLTHQEYCPTVSLDYSTSITFEVLGVFFIKRHIT